MMALALGYFALEKFWLSPTRQAAPPAQTVAAADLSIAVLPFVNMSPDPDQEYFSDGLTEELLNLLAGIDELKVAARTSSFYYKDKLDDIQFAEVARQLEVAHILEGSVRRSGNKIRITAQLIKAGDGFHMWSETYDRELDDIFAIQDEIAAAVTEQLRITLLGESPHSKVIDAESWELAQKGRFYYNRRQPGDIERALAAFERAVELDPDNEQAWVGLAPIYGLFGDSPDLERSRQALEKAFAINPDNVEAHVRMSGRLTNHDPALKQYHRQRALQLAPQNPMVLTMQAFDFVDQGDINGAIEYQLRAVRADPLSGVLKHNLIYMLLNAGRLQEVAPVVADLEELAPGHPHTRKYQAELDLLQGRPREALPALEQIRNVEDVRFLLSASYFSLGDQEASNRALEEFRNSSDGEVAMQLTYLHSWRGEIDLAFEFLILWKDEFPGQFIAFSGSPYLQNLHGDSRWTMIRQQPLSEAKH